MYRSEIHKRFPEHSICGEEIDDYDTNSDFKWIIDPIDGTYSYIRGVPLVGSLLGLMHRGEVKYGFLYLPYLNNSRLSGDGTSCLLNGKHVISKKLFSWDNSLILTTDIEFLRNTDQKSLWEQCIKKGSVSRTWGDCFGYYLLCTGKADMMIDIQLKDVDILPLYPILKAADLIVESERNEDGTTNLVAMTRAMSNELLNN